MARQILRSYAEASRLRNLTAIVLSFTFVDIGISGFESPRVSPLNPLPLTDTNGEDYLVVQNPKETLSSIKICNMVAVLFRPYIEYD